MRIERTTQGIIAALGAVTGISLFFTVPGLIGEALDLNIVTVPYPSADLLRGIASLGSALVLAYVVQAAWMVREAEPDDDREYWVGFVTGTGFAGLIGVVLALALAEHRAAGHSNALDGIGWGWICISQGLLAGVVMIQPLLVYQFAHSKEKTSTSASAAAPQSRAPVA